MMKNVYGLGRSRDKKGDWVGVHLNPYVNCIHTRVGGGFETMMVLIVEVYEEKESVGLCDERKE